MITLPHTRSIAVVGLFSSGKTVLLTSLLHHLRNHQPERLPLQARRHPGQPVTVTRFQWLTHGLPSGFEPFPFEAYRTALSENGTWPRKTRSCYAARCRFNRSDRRRPFDLTFLDVPGERFADIRMGGRSFDEWSDALLADLRVSPGVRPRLEAYESGLRTNPDPGSATRAYKGLLASLLRDYRPMISPSVFLLDEQGRQPDMRLPEDTLAEQRLCGLERGAEFAPLPPAIRAAHPDLRLRFARHYRNYVRTVPDPLFRHLARTHRLVMAIDVPGLLCDSVQRFNDMHRMFSTLLAQIAPQSPFAPIQRMLAPLWAFRHISRVAVAATKLDLVHRADGGEQATRLAHLAEEMVGAMIRDRFRRYRVFPCAALRSTEPARDGILGFPAFDPQGRPRAVPPREARPERIETSLLPETLPDDWQPGDFRFPEVHARAPANMVLPPRQDGLHRLIDYLLQEGLWET